jgi:hypothetical protein
MKLLRRQRFGLERFQPDRLIVLAPVEVLSNQHLLFASLASSAFLIYTDPAHEFNKVPTSILAPIGCAALVSWVVMSSVERGEQDLSTTLCG